MKKIRIKSLTPRVGKYNINNIVFDFNEDSIAEINYSEENEIIISEILSIHEDIELLSSKENEKQDEESEKNTLSLNNTINQLKEDLSKEVEKNATLLKEKIALETELNIYKSKIVEGNNNTSTLENKEIQKEVEVTNELVTELQKLTLVQLKETILLAEPEKFPEEEWKVLKNKADIITYIVNKA